MAPVLQSLVSSASTSTGLPWFTVTIGVLAAVALLVVLLILCLGHGAKNAGSNRASKNDQHRNTALAGETEERLAISYDEKYPTEQQQTSAVNYRVDEHLAISDDENFQKDSRSSRTHAINAAASNGAAAGTNQSGTRSLSTSVPALNSSTANELIALTRSELSGISVTTSKQDHGGVIVDDINGSKVESNISKGDRIVSMTVLFDEHTDIRDVRKMFDCAAFNSIKLEVDKTGSGSQSNGFTTTADVQTGVSGKSKLSPTATYNSSAMFDGNNSGHRSRVQSDVDDVDRAFSTGDLPDDDLDLPSGRRTMSAGPVMDDLAITTPRAELDYDDAGKLKFGGNKGLDSPDDKRITSVSEYRNQKSSTGLMVGLNETHELGDSRFKPIDKRVTVGNDDVFRGLSEHEGDIELQHADVDKSASNTFSLETDVTEPLNFSRYKASASSSSTEGKQKVLAVGVGSTVRGDINDNDDRFTFEQPTIRRHGGSLDLEHQYDFSPRTTSSDLKPTLQKLLVTSDSQEVLNGDAEFEAELPSTFGQLKSDPINVRSYWQTDGEHTAESKYNKKMNAPEAAIQHPSTKTAVSASGVGSTGISAPDVNTNDESALNVNPAFISAAGTVGTMAVQYAQQNKPVTDSPTVNEVLHTGIDTVASSVLPANSKNSKKKKMPRTKNQLDHQQKQSLTTAVGGIGYDGHANVTDGSHHSNLSTKKPELDVNTNDESAFNVNPALISAAGTVGTMAVQYAQQNKPVTDSPTVNKVLHTGIDMAAAKILPPTNKPHQLSPTSTQLDSGHAAIGRPQLHSQAAYASDSMTTDISASKQTDMQLHYNAQQQLDPLTDVSFGASADGRPVHDKSQLTVESKMNTPAVNATKASKNTKDKLDKKKKSKQSGKDVKVTAPALKGDLELEPNIGDMLPQVGSGSVSLEDGSGKQLAGSNAKVQVTTDSQLSKKPADGKKKASGSKQKKTAAIADLDLKHDLKDKSLGLEGSSIQLGGENDATGLYAKIQADSQLSTKPVEAIDSKSKKKEKDSGSKIKSKSKVSNEPKKGHKANAIPVETGLMSQTLAIDDMEPRVTIATKTDVNSTQPMSQYVKVQPKKEQTKAKIPVNSSNTDAPLEPDAKLVLTVEGKKKAQGRKKTSDRSATAQMMSSSVTAESTLQSSSRHGDAVVASNDESGLMEKTGNSSRHKLFSPQVDFSNSDETRKSALTVQLSNGDTHKSVDKKSRREITVIKSPAKGNVGEDSSC